MASKPELKQLGDFLAPVLVLPVGDKTYNIPAMTAQNSLIVEQAFAAASSEDGSLDPMKIKLGTEDDGPAFMTRVLGSAYQEMMDGGASLPALQHAMRIVTLWTWSGLEAAQDYYRSGGKVLPGQKKTPQDRKPKTATPTRTAAANTTQPQASRSGTSTRKATTNKPPAEPKS